MRNYYLDKAREKERAKKLEAVDGAFLFLRRKNQGHHRVSGSLLNPRRTCGCRKNA